MPILLYTIALLAGLGASASAEDFSGFYAGVNAGYARQVDEKRDRQSLGLPAGRDDATPTDSDLPPSARIASKDLRARSKAMPQTR